MTRDETGMTLSEKYRDEIADILSRYPVRRSALLPLLYLAQREQGYVTEAAMKEIAQILKLTPPQVYETITFYTMLNLKPVGRFHLQVCKSLMCALVGSDTLVGWIHSKLGIKPGETTQDKLFTLSVVECLGACGKCQPGDISCLSEFHCVNNFSRRIGMDYQCLATCK